MSKKTSAAVALRISDPDKFRFELAICMQIDASIRGRPLIHGEVVAARLELAAGRRRADYLHAVMFAVIGLMNMAEDRQTHFARRANALEKYLRFIEADRIQPGAAHWDGRMMQAQHDVIGIAGINRLVQALILGSVDGAAGTVGFTTIEADNQPVLHLGRVAIIERRGTDGLLHELANVVIARHTMNGKLQRADELNETLVCAGGFVLNQIPGYRNQVCRPVAGSTMLNNVR